MQKIYDVNQRVQDTVKDKNHPFLMTGQALTEWVRAAIGGDASLNNFVPYMGSVQMLERKLPDTGDVSGLTNIITFGMGVISIFERSVFSQPDPNNEKKLPIFNYYIGNKLGDDVKRHMDTLELNPTSIVVDIIDYSYMHDDLNNWKQPTFSVGQENRKIIHANSSHYLYLGYLYLVGLAWEKDFNVYLLEKLPLEQCVELLFDFIKQNYAGIAIKN